MRSDGAPEHGTPERDGREVGTTTSRPTPLALVSDAVAGGDLRGVAETAARALGCAVVVAIPALGPPAIVPEGSVDEATAAAIGAYAESSVSAGARPEHSPAAVSEAVTVQIAEQVVGIVAAVGAAGGSRAAVRDRRAWLEAAATAASVTALIQEAGGRPAPLSPGAEILAELAAGEPADLAAVLGRARRAGVELRGGAVALAARHAAGVGAAAVNGSGARTPDSHPPRLPAEPAALIALPAAGRLRALVPLSAAVPGAAETFATALRADGWTVVLSAPRRDPTFLRQALLEAELLGELHARDALAPGQENTYRLLIGVMLRDPDELVALREQTVSALADYDARHDTDLLATLHAFLRHDGSTTETAEAMRLHRHTVGYRLARVHEVSGLSPYESTGRERLSLGLKAEQIIASAQRCAESQLTL